MSNILNDISPNTTSSHIPIADSEYIPKSVPTLQEMADANPNVRKVKDRGYAILSDLQYLIEHKSNLLQEKQLMLCKHKDHIVFGVKLELDIKRLEWEIEKLVSHRKAISCCTNWGIHVANEKDPDSKFRKPINCRSKFCPKCQDMGSESHILRCQNGWDLIKQCHKAFIDVGHIVWTTPPEMRRSFLDGEKIKQLQKAVVDITQRYLGVSGIVVSFHAFGEPDEDGYSEFAPHMNLLFPLADKEGIPVKKYKLTPQQILEMKHEYAVALTAITGEKLGKPVKQESRINELNFHYRWFYIDPKTKEWWGTDTNGNPEQKNMEHLIYYDFRSTFDPQNIIQHDDKVKEFIYFDMVGFHLVKGFGSLSNSTRSKFLKKLNPEYQKREKHPFRCPVTNEALKVVKLHGSNRVLISNIRHDSTVHPIQENIENSNSPLYASENIIYALQLKAVGYISFFVVAIQTKVCEMLLFKAFHQYRYFRSKMKSFLNIDIE